MASDMSEMLAMATTDIMEQDGEIAQIVVIRPEEIVEIEFNSTPAENHLVEIMGGRVTIIGQYYSNNVTLLKLREPAESLPVYTPKLHAPFHELEIRGPVALIRMSKDATCMNFTKADFDAFMLIPADELAKQEQLAIEEKEKEIEAKGEFNEELYAEENEEEDDEIPEEEFTDQDVQEFTEEAFNDIDSMKDQMLAQIIDFYQQEEGRVPTAEEVKDAMKKLLMAMVNPEAAEDEEEYEDDAEEMAEEPKPVAEEKENVVGQKRPLENAEETDAKKQKIEE